MTATRFVSTAAELQAALGAAAAGDMIQLSAGDYGNVVIRNRRFGGGVVTLAPASAASPAVFRDLDIYASEGLRFEGLNIHRESGPGGDKLVYVGDSCARIQFVGCDIGGTKTEGIGAGFGVLIYADHVLFENNHIHNVGHGAAFFGCAGLEVIGNTFDHLRSDSLKFAGVHDASIMNNVGAPNLHPEKEDHIDFIQFQGSSSKVRIVGNLLLSAYTGRKVYQGIFLHGVGDWLYSDILIEDNLLYGNGINGIFVSHAERVAIRRNTVLAAPESGWPYVITLPNPVGENPVEHNVANIGGHGIKAQYEDPAKPGYYDDLYVNATAGYGLSIEDFRPVEGGPVDFGSGMGATELIAKLLTLEPSDPPPKPPVDEDPPAEESPALAELKGRIAELEHRAATLQTEKTAEKRRAVKAEGERDQLVAEVRGLTGAEAGQEAAKQRLIETVALFS